MPFTNLHPVDRRSTSTIIADTIRERIADGTFEPGMQLTEAQLAERLGVSRGPVRESFQRLVQEGLLTAEPHRGVFVATLDAEDASDVALARLAVERTAVERLAETGDPATLAALHALVDEMGRAADTGTWAEVAAADLRFHETLVAGAGSPRLTRMYATLVVETHLCLRLLLPAQHPDPSEIVAEHRTLLAALTAGDATAAGACIAGHLDAS
jgi:DNA-binding GntR family transcriptional regulator